MAKRNSKAARKYVPSYTPPVSLPNFSLTDAEIAQLIKAASRNQIVHVHDVATALSELKDRRMADAKKDLQNKVKFYRKNIKEAMRLARELKKYHSLPENVKAQVDTARYWNHRLIQGLFSYHLHNEVWK